MGYRLAALSILLATTASAEPSAERGRALAEENCARCHAVGRTGTSPLPQAPPFRTLSERYPLDTLWEAFAEGIVTGHPQMPEFHWEPEKIEDLMAYLGTLVPAEDVRGGAVEDGRKLAEHNCARCHAIAGPGPSPVGDAPPFSTLARRWPLESLAEPLAEGIMVNHPDVEMPEFTLDADEISALLAYLQVIQQ